MSKTTVEAITQSQWESSGGFVSGSGTLDFAVSLYSSSSTVAPAINGITVNYQTTNTLTSSIYDSTDAGNVIGKIDWTESGTSGSETVKFQIRSSADNVTWSNWCGYADSGSTCTGSNYFENGNGKNQGLTASHPLQRDANDRYFQYRVLLGSGGAATPTMSDVTITYVVNGAPAISNVTASQTSTGTISIGYTLADTDSSSFTVAASADLGITVADNPLTSGATTINLAGNYSYLPTGSQTIIIESEQITCTSRSGAVLSTCTRGVNNTSAAAHAQTTVVWAKAITATGNIGAGQTTGSGKTITWTVKTDFNSVYRNGSQGKIRVTANDGNIANQVGNGDSSTFVIDTTNPVPGTNPVLADASTTPSTITLSCTDNSALQMKVGMAADLSDASWESYNATKTLALATDPDTVYAQFKDAYGNTTAISNNTTPETPTAVMVQDTSNMKMTPSEYRLFTAWKIVANPTPGFGSYKVYRSENQIDWTLVSFSPAGITDRAVNYYGDSTTVFDTRYYYKVKTTDAVGNVSYFSGAFRGRANGTQDEDEGGGGSAPGDFPQISEVTPGTPTSTSVNITWETDDPSDSVVQYMTATGGDFEGNNALSKGNATFADSDGNLGDHSVTLTGLESDRDYYFQVISTSSSGATTTDKDGTDGYTFHTASGPAITGLTVSSETNDGATVSWDTTGSNSTSYVYYSTDSGLANAIKEGLNNSVASHSVPLSGLSANTTYYFKVESTDANGATSILPTGAPYNTFTTNDSVAPGYVSGNEPTNLLTSWNHTAIYWQTDEQAIGQVRYKKGFESYSSWYPASPTDYNASHYITLTSLDADTTYTYQVRSTDIAANVSSDSNEYTFTTQRDPSQQHNDLDRIANIAESIVTDAKAAITFETQDSGGSPVAARCTIEFGEDTGYHEIPVTEADFNEEHSIHLTGLFRNTPYYYWISCEDNNGNTAAPTDNPLDLNFTTLKTQVDQHDPLGSISTPADANGSDSADITRGDTYSHIYWTTDQVANAHIGCSTSQGGPYTQKTAEDLTHYNKSHLLKIENLAVDTKYYCEVTSIDDLGSPAKTSSEFSFTTLKTQIDQHNPLNAISTPADANGADSADITRGDTYSHIYWTTDQVANQHLGCSITPGSYTEKTAEDLTHYNKSHMLKIDSLTANTKYYCQATSIDDLGSPARSSAEFSFTTLEGEGAGDDITGPEISGVKTSAITGESVTVSWETDETSNSLVAYGITSGTYEGSGADNLVNADPTDYVTDHEVIINNLTPGTKYYFVTRSINTSGLVGESDESSFTTKSASNLSSIKFSSIKLGEATITWKTSSEMSSTVEYGLTEIYGEAKESSTLTKNHEITISGLEQNQEYHLRVKGEDELNNLYSSGDYTFTPKSPPQISGVKVEEVTEHEVTIVFTTNIATDSLITYTKTTNSDTKETNDKEEGNGSQGKPDLTTNHELILKNLSPGTSYQYTITVKDIDGNSATEPDPGSSPGQSLRFTTGLDENPPKIDQVRTDSALAQNDKVQSIISWITDEPADTALVYKEGLNAESKEVLVSKIPTTSHIAVITTFKPGTVYYFKAKSTDSSNNTALSSDFALLTPKRKENIIQIIIANFQEIFGWARF